MPGRCGSSPWTSETALRQRPASGCPACGVHPMGSTLHDARADPLCGVCPLTKDAHAHPHALSGTSQRTLPISVDERALSATDVSYVRRHLADTELLMPTTTHDESMGHVHRPHSASPTSPPDVVTDARRTPLRAGSCPHVHHGPAVSLALPIRTRALDGDTDQRASIGRHRPAILVPIWMFPGQATIIIHERFHGVG